MRSRGEFTAFARAAFGLRRPPHDRDASEPGGESRASVAAKVCVVAGTVCMIVVVALHLGLLTRGSWGGDEYKTIGLYRDHGTGYLWFRFSTWSPRPLSEALIWLYATAVIEFMRPLIVPALAVFWFAAIASIAPALYRAEPGELGPHALGAMAILVMIILGRRVAAVFYWPFGAVAYVPVIAACLFLLFVLANERARHKAGGIVLSLFLIAAAWSSEAGALLVLICSAAMMILPAVVGHRDRGYLAVWIPPLLASLLVIGMVVSNNRASTSAFAMGYDAIYHHTFASLAAALTRFVPEFVSWDGETFDARHLIRGAVVKLLFFVGVHFCWVRSDPAAKPRGPGMPIFAASIVIAAFGMLVASFREFGGPCCSQHVFLRQSLELIALAAVAMWIPPLFAISRNRRLIAASAALVLAAGVMLNVRRKDIEEGYRFYGESARARAWTWESGFSDGPAMTLYQPFSSGLFPPQIPPGLQTSSDNWWTEAVLIFFHKQSVLVRVAAQPGDE